MLQYVEFDGKQVPAIFGNAAFYHYEKNTGRSAVGDFFDAIGNSNTEEFNPLRVKLSYFTDMAYYAFIAGGNKVRQPFPYPIEDVAIWVTIDRVKQMTEWIVDALPKPKTAEEGEVEQPGETATTATTGKPV